MFLPLGAIVIYTDCDFFKKNVSVIFLFDCGRSEALWSVAMKQEYRSHGGERRDQVAPPRLSGG